MISKKVLQFFRLCFKFENQFPCKDTLNSPSIVPVECSLKMNLQHGGIFRMLAEMGPMK